MADCNQSLLVLLCMSLCLFIHSNPISPCQLLGTSATSGDVISSSGVSQADTHTYVDTIPCSQVTKNPQDEGLPPGGVSSGGRVAQLTPPKSGYPNQSVYPTTAQPSSVNREQSQPSHSPLGSPSATLPSPSTTFSTGKASPPGSNPAGTFNSTSEAVRNEWPYTKADGVSTASLTTAQTGAGSTGTKLDQARLADGQKTGIIVGSIAAALIFLLGVGAYGYIKKQGSLRGVEIQPGSANPVAGGPVTQAQPGEFGKRGTVMMGRGLETQTGLPATGGWLDGTPLDPPLSGRQSTLSIQTVSTLSMSYHSDHSHEPLSERIPQN